MHSNHSENRILCSICIPTYRRREMLAELLDSLESQVLPEGVRLEIIVVENDTRRTSESLVRARMQTSAHAYKYAVQPVKNISLTRNTTVALAEGDFFLFIDDDETACRDWVEQLLSSRKRFDADGVFGYLMPEFHAATPRWLRSRRLYYGSMAETGSTARYTYTGNCLLKASLLNGMPEPFDARYGRTGGEDVHLFQRLRGQGAKFITCKEAVIFEKVPPDRTTVPYLFKRGLRGGYIHTKRCLEADPRPAFLRYAPMLAKSVSYGTLSLFLAVVFFLNRGLGTYWIVRVGSNTGRFLAVLGRNIEEY